MNRAVLLVEDLENDVFLINRTWAKAGIQIPLHSVSDGHLAIAYLAGDGAYADRQKYPLPCLVLLDLKLPYLMGMDVLTWIRSQSHLRGLPVIILTSSALQRDIDEAYQLGANAFLVKPSDIFQLGEMVRLIRDFWLQANQLPRIEGDVADATSARPSAEG